MDELTFPIHAIGSRSDIPRETKVKEIAYTYSISEETAERLVEPYYSTDQSKRQEIISFIATMPGFSFEDRIRLMVRIYNISQELAHNFFSIRYLQPVRQVPKSTDSTPAQGVARYPSQMSRPPPKNPPPS